MELSYMYKEPTGEMYQEFEKIGEFETFNDFFDKYADGKRVKNGIHSHYKGYDGECTMFWIENEEYPFSFCFPAYGKETFCCTFYLRRSRNSAVS